MSSDTRAGPQGEQSSNDHLIHSPAFTNSHLCHNHSEHAVVHRAERVQNGDEAIEKRLRRVERGQTLRGGEDLVTFLQGMRANTTHQRIKKRIAKHHTNSEGAQMRMRAVAESLSSWPASTRPIVRRMRCLLNRNTVWPTSKHVKRKYD